MELHELYPAYFSALAGYARKLTGERMAGEDVAQETFMRAMQNAPLLSRLTDAQQKSWLYTTARRIVIDQSRRAARTPPPEDEPIHLDDLTQLEVVQLLERLPPDSAQIVRMKVYAGLNSTEIGMALSLPPATVRTKLRTALEKLRRYIDYMG